MKKALLLCLVACTMAMAQKKARIQITPDDAQKKIDVTIDDKPFTAYIYPGPDVLKKPVLYPIRTAGGNFITRGWPMDPRPGERVDHPHHVGMWFNYGDVNGHDFWNNSNDVKGHGGPFGTIVHTGVKSMKSGNDQAELTVTADWLDKDGKPMLKEETTFIFRGKGNERSIDRSTTLKALDKDVVFKDNKEGMVAIRLARQLEHPSNKPEVFTDANGIATKVAQMDNSGVVGHYHSSEGVEGEDVWGKRAKWMNLTGELNGEKVSIAIFDNPKNVGYPTYWHARGYGLYAANPLAPSVFTNGKEAAMNYTLPAGKSVTFRYKVLITSGAVSDAALNAMGR
nr:PmoA family protein [uncultured Arsenicibacter sp.]